MASTAYDGTMRVLIRTDPGVSEDVLREILDGFEINLDVLISAVGQIRITAGSVWELTRAPDADEA